MEERFYRRYKRDLDKERTEIINRATEEAALVAEAENDETVVESKDKIKGEKGAHVRAPIDTPFSPTPPIPTEVTRAIFGQLSAAESTASTSTRKRDSSTTRRSPTRFQSSIIAATNGSPAAQKSSSGSDAHCSDARDSKARGSRANVFSRSYQRVKKAVMRR